MYISVAVLYIIEMFVSFSCCSIMIVYGLFVPLLSSVVKFLYLVGFMFSVPISCVILKGCLFPLVMSSFTLCFPALAIS